MMNQPASGPAPVLPPVGNPQRGVGQQDLGKLEVHELASSAVNPRELVKRVAENSKWPCEDLADELLLTLPIGTLRKQQVHVIFDRRDEDGLAIRRSVRSAGQPREKNALTLLRFNSKLAHGAFAVSKIGEADSVVLQANLLNDSLNTVAVTQIVSAIAFQADQVEEKLMGTDSY